MKFRLAFPCRKIPVPVLAALLAKFLIASGPAQSSTNTLFQYAAFYNLDLDFSPGQPMVFNGKVHVNGTFWMYPQNTATFNDTVEATIIVTNKDNPNDQQNLTTNINNFEAQLATEQKQLTQQFSQVNASLQAYPLLLQQVTETLATMGGTTGSGGTTSSSPTLTSGL